MKKRRGRRKNVEGVDLLFMNRSRVPAAPDQVARFYTVLFLEGEWGRLEYICQSCIAHVYISNYVLIAFEMKNTVTFPCIPRCLQGGVVLARWAWPRPLHQATATVQLSCPPTQRAECQSSTSKMAPGLLGTTPPGGKIWSSGWKSTLALWQIQEPSFLWVLLFCPLIINDFLKKKFIKMQQV